jgi:hypothetical protein
MQQQVRIQSDDGCGRNDDRFLQFLGTMVTVDFELIADK